MSETLILCRKCSTPKARADFFTRSNGKHRTPCKACYTKRSCEYAQKDPERRHAWQRDYYHRNIESRRGANRRRMMERRRELLVAVQALKVNRGCLDCGYRKHPAALDFDHIRGEKRASVSVLVARCVSLPTLRAEMDKCVVRCAVCHRIRTHSEDRRYTPRVKMSVRVAEQRKALRGLLDASKAHPCEDCGLSYPIVAMDLDHRDPTLKNRNVSRMIHSECSLALVQAEIAKCRLVCANCHRTRTYDGYPTSPKWPSVAPLASQEGIAQPLR